MHEMHVLARMAITEWWGWAALVFVFGIGFFSGTSYWEWLIRREFKKEDSEILRWLRGEDTTEKPRLDSSRRPGPLGNDEVDVAEIEEMAGQGEPVEV